MAFSHLNKGTVFLHPSNKSKKLERAVTRLRERLGRKQSEWQTREWRSRTRLHSSPPPRGKHPVVRSSLLEYEVHDDRFMPEITGLAEYRFRSQLNRLGMEVIRLNDRGWNKNFVKKIQDNYQSLLDHQEEMLEEKEKKRLHKLRLAGIITDDVLKLQGAKHRQVNRRQSLEVAMLAQQHNEMEIMKQKIGQPLFRDELSNAKGKELAKRLARKTYDAPKELPFFEHLVEVRGGEERLLLESTENLRQRIADSAGSASTEVVERKKKRVPYEVAQLYEEKTVAGLYALGELLVYIEPKPEEKEEESDETTGYY